MRHASVQSTGCPLFAAACFTVSLLMLGGCDRKGSEAESAAPAAPAEVLVVAAEEQHIPSSRDWVATLDGTANAVVQARVQGYLDKQFYQNGTVVKVGDPLFLIDPRPFQASLEQAKANLLNAEAKAVETDLTEKRQVSLFASHSVSEAERDQAVQMNSAAKANVKAAQAGVLNAQLNVDYTTVTAPIVGIAGIARPGIGDLVGPAYGELCSISTVDPIKAVFQISEQEYMRAAAQNVIGSSQAQSTPDGVKWQLVLADGKIVDGGKVDHHQPPVRRANRHGPGRGGISQSEQCASPRLLRACARGHPARRRLARRAPARDHRGSGHAIWCPSSARATRSRSARWRSATASGRTG